MTSTAQILRSKGKVDYVLLFAISGCRTMFASHHCIAGTGPGSWIGTEHGDRQVVPGLIPPPRIGLGRSSPAHFRIYDRDVEFKLVDMSDQNPGIPDLATVFRARYPDAEVEHLGRRILPTEDPAPEQVLGIGQVPVPLWDRSVGNEHIGPAGERNYYWLAPSDIPPAPTHPETPTQMITPGPTVWTNRKCALYIIVRDPETGHWRSWDACHPDGELWRGVTKDQGAFGHDDEGRRTWTIRCSGPEAWYRKALNTARPERPRHPWPVVELDEGQDSIAVWFRGENGGFIEGVGWIETSFNAAVFHPSHSLAGLTDAQQIAAHVRAVAKTTALGEPFGGIDPGTTYRVGATDTHWGKVSDNRAIGATTSGVSIRMEAEGVEDWQSVVIVMHAKAWAAWGYDVHAQPNFTAVEQAGWLGVLPVGGASWNAPPGANEIPGPGYYRGTFRTYDGEDTPDSKKANGGQWKLWPPAWAQGTVILDANPGQVLRVAIGELQCAGQMARPLPSSSIHGKPVTAAGWWLFEGPRQDPGEEEPRDFVQVAWCSWVAVESGGAVAVDAQGFASIRVERWEDPRLFGFEEPRMASPWVSTPESLSVTPMGVVGGAVANEPDYAHLCIGRLLLSSGTATWKPGGQVEMGSNSPPGLEGEELLASDREVQDLGCGIPHPYVDLPSLWACADRLPSGGRHSPLNRVQYALIGTQGLKDLWLELLGGRGWAWSLKPPAGGGLRRYGIFDPYVVVGPGETDATITDADLLGPARIELRQESPFDFFPFEVDRNPRTRETAHKTVITSLDERVHLRSGQIGMEVLDGGLRRPSKFKGKPEVFDWLPAARQRFGSTLGPYYERRHFVLQVPIKAHKVPELGLGSWVRLSLSDVPHPAGGYGIDHIGYVLELDTFLTGENALAGVVTLRVHERGVDEITVSGPVAWAYGFDTETGKLSISADFAEHGKGHSDTICFTEPEWSTTGGGPLRVRVWQSENGKDYPESMYAYADVLEVDPDGNTLTLANLEGHMILPSAYKLITAAGWNHQTPGGWARTIFAYNTGPDGTFGDPPKKGAKL